MNWKNKLIDILITAVVAGGLAFLQSLLTGLTAIDPTTTATIAVALKTTLPALT
ncbi:MAG: hypothetical protein WC766_06470 [Patescibacteria group bacterium]